MTTAAQITAKKMNTKPDSPNVLNMARPPILSPEGGPPWGPPRVCPGDARPASGPKQS